MTKSVDFPRVVADAIASVNPRATRRDFLKSSGALVLTMSVGTIPGGRALAQAAAGPYPDPDFLELDTWIVMTPNRLADTKSASRRESTPSASSRLSMPASTPRRPWMALSSLASISLV